MKTASPDPCWARWPVGLLAISSAADAATVVGALGGGYAGNQIQGSMQEGDTYTTTQQRCKTVYDKSEKMLGYDVTYKIGDQQGKIRMDRDPGTQIPLDSNGQLILTNKA